MGPDRPDRKEAMSLHTLPRLFVARDGATFADDMDIQMADGQARYLGGVLRREVGDEVRLFNDDDGEWLAKISEIRKDRGSFRLQQNLRSPAAEKGPVLVFALLKRDATDLVIRMGTELGVSRFVPVITERTVIPRANGERLRAIAVEAAEQSERLTVPLVEEPVRLKTLLGEWPAENRLYVARERSAVEFPAGINPLTEAVPGDGLLTGPEGGFTPSELDVLSTRTFVTYVSLGERVLRAETAIAAGLALMQACP